MRRRAPEWYDSQYNARAAIPDAAAILEDWSARSARTRAQTRCMLDLPYSPRGASDRSERLDVFLPRQLPTAGAPVLVHVHGGYWRALHKEDQSFVAEPFVDAGAIVVVPNYALCPQVSISHIVMQMVQALAWTWRHARDFGGDASRIVVTGHSAGGHLATMMLACDWPAYSCDLPPSLVRTAVAVSGLFDLEPLRRAPFLAPDLGLSETEALRVSPISLAPPRGKRLLAFVGELESTEFQRQARSIRSAWGTRVVSTPGIVPSCHHMSVLNALANPQTSLHAGVVDALGLDRTSTTGLSAPVSARPSMPSRGPHEERLDQAAGLTR